MCGTRHSHEAVRLVHAGTVMFCGWLHKSPTHVQKNNSGFWDDLWSTHLVPSPGNLAPMKHAPRMGTRVPLESKRYPVVQCWSSRELSEYIPEDEGVTERQYFN